MTSSNEISWKLHPRNEELFAPLVHAVNTEEEQTLKYRTRNYCIRSSSYRNVT